MTQPASALAPLALTMGEPGGIGGEITLKAWHARKSVALPFFVIDDPDRLSALARAIGLPTPVTVISDPAEAAEMSKAALPILPVGKPISTVPGRLSPLDAPAVLSSIETAVSLVRAGRASAVVTNPINKENLYDAGFSFPGHTEYLASLAKISTPPVMMLASPLLKVVPVTIHVSLADAIRTLSTDLIVETARIAAEGLQRDFGIDAPRLALAGLNPHAGEGGAMGLEDAAIVAPAVARLRAQGIDARGPLPADTMFTPRARAGYDVALGMYHDQALIPIKTLDFDGGVNVTLGLPFVRTSPDHGTALDIAGTGQAAETSLIAALNMAAGMAVHRALADARSRLDSGA